MEITKLLFSCADIVYEDAEEKNKTSPLSGAPSTNMKVLIVDDSRTMRRLLSSYLSPFATEIVQAEDGIHALEQLRSAAPLDLALFDWNMPRMNGLELVKAVRNEAAHSEMKIVMVTSRNTMEDIGTVLGAGATEFLMKPITEEMVQGKLRLLGMIC